MLFASSSEAYGEPLELPEREDGPLNAHLPYAVVKLAGEKYLEAYHQEFGMRTTALRLFNVYGPRQTTASDGPYATVIGIFLEQRKNNQPMTIVPDGTQRRDFTHVTDVAAANLLAMSSAKVGAGEIVNVGTGKNYSVREVADMIGGAWEFAPPRQGEVHETLADMTRAKALLAWSPKVSFQDGISELKSMHGIA